MPLVFSNSSKKWVHTKGCLSNSGLLQVSKPFLLSLGCNTKPYASLYRWMICSAADDITFKSWWPVQLGLWGFSWPTLDPGDSTVRPHSLIGHPQPFFMFWLQRVPTNYFSGATEHISTCNISLMLGQKSAIRYGGSGEKSSSWMFSHLWGIWMTVAKKWSYFLCWTHSHRRFWEKEMLSLPESILVTHTNLQSSS